MNRMVEEGGDDDQVLKEAAPLHQFLLIWIRRVPFSVFLFKEFEIKNMVEIHT